MNTKRISLVLAGSFIMVASRVAMAHPGHAAGGIVAGLAHPFTGIDHLLAMLAVGLWAAQRGGRAMWQIPAAFLGLMAAGGIWAALGAPLLMVESGIAVSVLITGLLVATALAVPGRFAMAMVGAFAIFHGYAHIAEMGQTASATQYAIGFVLSTATLLAIGLSLGMLARRLGAMKLLRLVGVGIAAVGVALLAGWL
jgi:urease accessory protein